MNLDQAWPLLDKAQVLGDNLTKQAISAGISNGNFKLFTKGKSAALVANNNGFLRVGLAGGKLDELVEIERDISEYALEQGHRMIEIIGRDWSRSLPGYKKVAVILRKEL